MNPSLKRQLLVWLLIPLLVIMPIAAIIQYRSTLEPAKREIDRQLGDFAIAIAGFIKVNGNTVRFEMTPETEHLLRTDQLDTEYFLVLDPNGKSLAGDAALGTLEDEIAAGEFRYVDRTMSGQKMRMVIYGVACGLKPCQVRIAETLFKQERLHYKALIATLLSILALGLATAVIMLFAVRHALRPLQDLRSQLADRSLDDLRPLNAPQVPAEVQPLITALNQLFERMKKASDAQKSFIADAAHQLRTPLTEMQTESELALLEFHPKEIHPTLERLHRSASRAAKLANQLLTIARAESSVQARDDYCLTDLKEIGVWAANEWSHRSVVAGVDLGFELEPSMVKGQVILLQELLSNLIHNSIEHAGKGTHITVRTGILANQPFLEVEDDGPGIPPEEQSKVLQRFFRGHHAKGNGSGLGLAIVNEIVSIHRASLRFEIPASKKGLLVRIFFPILTEYNIAAI